MTGQQPGAGANGANGANGAAARRRGRHQRGGRRERERRERLKLALARSSEESAFNQPALERDNRCSDPSALERPSKRPPRGRSSEEPESERWGADASTSARVGAPCRACGAAGPCEDDDDGAAREAWDRCAVADDGGHAAAGVRPGAVLTQTSPTTGGVALWRVAEVADGRRVWVVPAGGLACAWGPLQAELVAHHRVYRLEGSDPFVQGFLGVAGVAPPTTRIGVAPPTTQIEGGRW